ncbi:hypothetical protein ACLQ2Q_12445 [Microbacterium sp. DT81.1]|uniref:hypothetical protein n=1 Tax=Microbacterium sp. DT81.1 TaxID=3393413 RepID=UPI003CF13BD3
MIDIDVRETAELFTAAEADPFLGRYARDAGAERILERMLHDRSVRRHPNPSIAVRVSEPADHDVDQIQTALEGYWDERIRDARTQRRRVWTRGLKELAIGVVFLAVCLAAAAALSTTSTSADSLQRFFIEGLIIVGWIALWHPVDMLLFGPWDLNAQLRALRRLRGAPVTLTAPDRIADGASALT